MGTYWREKVASEWRPEDWRSRKNHRAERPIDRRWRLC
ncbi:hypothetical protein AK973_5831 [Pseudomonas brassicacearum]|nr:hypothetical protein AK973_5831 [Pseudomonas brassicacearum]